MRHSTASRLLAATGLCCLLSLLSASGSFAQVYLPLSNGNIWRYQGLDGLSEDQVVAGMRVIRGTATSLIDYQNSSSSPNLENYWTTEPDGDVVLWGWWLEGEEFGILWEPPIKMVDAPLFLGKTWQVAATERELPDSTVGGTFLITFHVVGAGPISVPAGTFQTFAVAYTATIPAFHDGAFRLDGAQAVANLQGQYTEWYSDGIGKIQYNGDDIYQLTSFNVPTATEASSWGQVKRLFR